LRLLVRSPHTGGVTRFRFLTLVLVLMLCVAAADARASDGGGGEVRAAGHCGRGTSSSLRLRPAEERIEVRFRLRQAQGHGSWRITIVHENRVTARASRKTTRSDDSFEVRRTLTDLPGSDTVVVHAWGPRGLGCRATATLPERE
jgi:hypothetical protein